MKSIKCFKFVGCFNLPDDFEGGYDDAVRLMLEHHLSKEEMDKNQRPADRSESWDVQEQVDKLWANPEVKISMGVGIFNNGESVEVKKK